MVLHLDNDQYNPFGWYVLFYDFFFFFVLFWYCSFTSFKNFVVIVRFPHFLLIDFVIVLHKFD